MSNQKRQKPLARRKPKAARRNERERQYRHDDDDDHDRMMHQDMAFWEALAETNGLGITSVHTDWEWLVFAAPLSGRRGWFPTPRTKKGWVKRIKQMVAEKNAQEQGERQ